MSILAKYGTAVTVTFPLIKAGGNNFAVSADYTPQAGDVRLYSGSGSAAATNTPSAIALGNGGLWSLTLTATEMQAPALDVVIQDATTKAVEDQMLKIQTFGSGSTAGINLDDWADALLKRDMSAVSSEASRSPLNALRALRNKWSVSGDTLTITKEDDATSAWTSTITSSSAANPITASDPA